MTQAVVQPAGPDPASDRDWLERFEPLRPLGEAYWTRSLLCRNRRSGAQVVVREIRPAIWWHAIERLRALEALRREAEVLARLGPASGGTVFPALLEAAVEGEFPWIATEYLPGSTLRDRFPLGPDGRIPSESGWTLPQTLHAILSLRDGLRALHHMGSVHGLIHPDCLVLAETGHSAAGSGPRLRLRSLGWAAMPKGQMAVSDREALPYVDQYGLRSAGPPGPESDAWSVAAILFELIAGRPAFKGDPSRFEHEERFAVRRRMARGVPPGLPAQLSRELLAFFKSSFAAPEPVSSQEVGGEPLGGFFTHLAHCLEVAERDELWSQARLPNPDQERLGREIRSRRPTVSPSELEQHEMVWGRWRSATRQALEGFGLLVDLPESAPWSVWRREIDEDAANCIRREPKDDPYRDDSEALATRVQQIELRIASIGQICVDAWELLREPLRGVAEDLEAAVRENAGVLQRKDPALAGGIGTFCRDIDRLSADRITPDLFPVAARLSNEGANLHRRAHQVLAGISAEAERERQKGETLQRRQAAQVAFWQAVRSRDFEKARSVLETWPGGADDTTRRLAEGLGTWQTIEREAVALLAAPRTPQALASMRQLARKLGAEPPAGFETLARPLARQLEEGLEAPRKAARAAVEQARAFCAEQEEGAARAAERSLVKELPDSRAAANFCRALQALEQAVENATDRLSTTTDDVEFLMGLPATVRNLEDLARQARQAWWPGENLPRPQSEWMAFVEKINRLVTRGRAGIQEAHRQRKAQVPAGWEESARTLDLPPVPLPDPRRWMTLAAAATVVVGIGVLWIFSDRIGELIDKFHGPTPEPTPSISQATPNPTPPDAVERPTATPDVSPVAAEAWVHGPALATLYLRADGVESPSPFQLPTVVRFPGNTQVTLWLSSGEKQTRKMQTAGERGAIQKGVDVLAAELGDVPSHVEVLDAEIARRVEELLKGEQR
jgi:serine/threonine protein kinase